MLSRALGLMPVVLAAFPLSTLWAAEGQAASQAKVHCVVDISHEFTFYFDGRFATNYVTPLGSVGVQNWATLHKCDLSNANLLVLQSGGTPCPYLPEDIAAVRRFLEAGGGVCVLGDYALFRDEKEYRLNEVAKVLGAEFIAQAAAEPLKAAPELKAEEVRTYGGRTIRLETPADWQILIQDAAGRPVMARRAIGKGQLLLASRALAGHQPDAKDPINAQWWQPLLADLAKGKPVEPAKPLHGMSPENKTQKEGLAIQCSDYLQPLADEIFAIYKRCRPAMEQLLGVPPAKDMLTTLILLPTGGGGFSSGHAIGLGVWWGDFPAKRYGMVELLGHEATHSWVLPFGEPMWNEGIATYVGIRLGQELGYKAEADATLKGWIAGARRHDPDMKKLDLAAGKGIPHEVAMAKPMWIFEELRKERADILARYFQLKRKLFDPARVKRYTADDSVAVLSLAVGRDLFPWFQSLGVKVTRSGTTVAAP
ncbi:MAG: hypothetical protein FJ290_08010 [Planctomycetes bacterium]|nr:hypothetical protein [Planctomycetota bacterium]